MDNLEDWKKAGELTSKARAFGKEKIKIGVSLLKVTEEIEDFIYENGGKPAFPVQISVNNIAAHFNPSKDDEYIFRKGDLVKLDLGVHVNGCIGDTAISVDLGDNKELISASEEALKEAIKIVKPGVKLREIGKVIEKTITGKGFKPVRNLTGHEIKKYEEHAGMTIPNFDNGDETQLVEGQVIAIEPFATNGVGFIDEGKDSEIYKLLEEKTSRDMIARNVLMKIIKEYKVLPFAKRWLFKDFPEFKVNYALRLLEREKILHRYEQLVERDNGLVSQTEHTLLVQENPLILTK
ncbi:type II methionyl aminopeptidase [archaeon]|nr:type II methionyl aminopeptidase [archaeon]|tara:strand:+ start:8353 stop:9234 length:882 start_codon:yes stop_codon:yes gene_type:complete